jgi:hypothetical protein
MLACDTQDIMLKAGLFLKVKYGFATHVFTSGVVYKGDI